MSLATPDFSQDAPRHVSRKRAASPAAITAMAEGKLYALQHPFRASTAGSAPIR